MLAAFVIIPEISASFEVFTELISEISNSLWGNMIRGKTYIYGLEMIAFIAIFLVSAWQLRNKNVTVYIDNSNALGALERGYTDTKAVDKMARLFRGPRPTIGYPSLD